MGDPAGTPAAADSRAPVIAIEMSEATLQGGAARLIRRELDRLWSPYGLNVAWTDGVAGDSGECVAVKVMFTDDDPGIKAGPNRRPLGIVYRVGDLYRRVIFVSPAAVMRLVRKSSNEPRESQLVASLHARMMARVISHELGHILLESRPTRREADAAAPPSRRREQHGRRRSRRRSSPRVVVAAGAPRRARVGAAYTGSVRSRNQGGRGASNARPFVLSFCWRLVSRSRSRGRSAGGCSRTASWR
jgi:hypothetical protein